MFAFRLHQFFSGGSAVSVSLDPEAERHISTSGQLYVPGDRERLMAPLAFCRECGQEYVPVRLREEDGRRIAETREISDRSAGEGERNGYFRTSRPRTRGQPTSSRSVIAFPADWLDPETGDRQAESPRTAPDAGHVDPEPEVRGRRATGPLRAAPFRFCLSCGVAYGARQIAISASSARSVPAGGARRPPCLDCPRYPS